MSLLNNLFAWAQSSSSLAAVEQQAAKETARIIQQALNKAIDHAPDMRPQIEQGATVMLQAALAGLAMKAKG